MAGLRRPASIRGERDASARSLDVVCLAARKEGRTASPPLPCPSAHASPGSRGVGEVLAASSLRPHHRSGASLMGARRSTRHGSSLPCSPTGSLVLLGVLAVQLLRTLTICCTKL